MQRLVRLSLFALVVSVLVFGSMWLFQRQLLGLLFGIDFDRGDPGVTQLQLPAGFSADVFAEGLAAPRFMAVSPDGVLFVAEPGADRVVALPDRDGDGRADSAIVVGEGFDAAHSLAFAEDGSLLVAGSGTLYLVVIDAELREVEREAILTYPGGGGHSTRTIVVTPDGSMLVSVGSTCNACWEKDERRAAILRTPGGGASEVHMRGLRNAVGLAVDPTTGTAWATNMGRDYMGDDLPPETLYRIEAGADAGWPRCHAGDIPDPDLGEEPDPEPKERMTWNEPT